MKSTQIKLNDELIIKLKRLAKRNDMTISQVIEKLFDFYNQFDHGFLGKLEEFYHTAGSIQQLPVILERLALITLAERDSERDVQDVSAPILLVEAADNGLDTWKFYKNEYDNKLRQFKAAEEYRKAQECLAPYLQLTPEGQAINKQAMEKAMSEYLEKHPDQKEAVEKAKEQQEAWRKRKKT